MLIILIQNFPLSAGSIIAWGLNDNGQANVPSGDNYVAIAAGEYHSLALDSDGFIEAWGLNSSAQLSVPADSNNVAIAAGGYHSLAIKSDGSLTGWGDDTYLQASCPADNDYIAVAAGRFHSLALKSDGSLLGWGFNANGQTDVPSGTDYVAVAAGNYHSLALRSNGSLAVWGSDLFNQAEIPTGSLYAAIAAGAGHILTINDESSLIGWGNDYHGQATAPTGYFIAIAAGESHSLAVTDSGSLIAWGDNASGQTSAPLDDGYIAVAAGKYHNLVLTGANSITLTSPDGSENWFNSETEIIAWQSSGDIPVVMIEYSVDSGQSWQSVFADDVIYMINSGSYSWTVPDKISDSTLVRISAAHNPAVGDAVDSVFTIHPRPMTCVVTGLGTLGGADSYGNSINDNNVIVGYSSNASDIFRAFSWQSQVITDLGALGGNVSIANDVNNIGVVAGESYTAVANIRGFLWKDSQTIELGALSWLNSMAYGVNSNETVAGASQTEDGVYHAFYWNDLNGNSQDDPNEMVDLGAGCANDINESGWIVGKLLNSDGSYHAALWCDADADGVIDLDDTDEMVDLGTLGGSSSQAFSINDAGVIVGESLVESGHTHAFIWRDNQMTDLGAVSGHLYSYAYSINNDGYIVGASAYDVNYDSTAVIWDPDNNITILYDSLPVDSGWNKLNSASAINVAGKITGWGTTDAAQMRGFLLEPAYNLELIQPTGGVITSDVGTGGFADQTAITLTAGATAGREFVGWTGTDDDSVTANPLALTLYHDLTVSAQFTVSSHSLATSSLGGGSVTPTAGVYDYGSVVTLTAIPDVNYHVSSWHGTDDDASVSNTNIVTIDSDKNVYVQFAVLTKTLTTVVTQGAGTVAPSGVNAYNINSNVVVTAVPDENHTFNGFYDENDNLISAESSIEMLMTDDVTVSVKFDPMPVTLTVTVIGSNGEVMPETCECFKGQVIALTARPEYGYRVKKWFGTDDDNSVEGANSVTMDGSKIVTVEFETDFSPMNITRCTVKAGNDRSDPRDSFIISGTNFAAVDTDITQSDSIVVEIYNVISETPVYYERITHDPTKLRNGMITYVGARGRISLLRLNLNRMTFDVKASDVSLAGLLSPMILRISAGNYIGAAVAADSADDLTAMGVSVRQFSDVLNGSQEAPFSFAAGYTDKLQIDFWRFRSGRAVNTDMLMVRGKIALVDPDDDLTDTDFTVTAGDFTHILSAENFSHFGGKLRYRSPAGTAPTVRASFDIERQSFNLFIHKSDFQTQAAPAQINIAFDEFDETAQLQ